MKRIKFILGVIFLTAVLSGCSTAPSNSSTGSTSLASFTFSQSIWKTADNGETWKVENTGEGKANTTKVSVLSLAVNPSDGNNAYAGLKSGGILETSNGGETWKFMNNFTSEKVYGLAVDPSGGKTLYASAVWQGTGKIFKTLDDGISWKEIYTSPAGGPLVISLMLSQKNPGVIYATTSDNAVIKSVDGGTSWKNIYLANAPILKIAEDAANGSLLYAVTNSGVVFRTKDGGANFEDITTNVGKTTKSYGSSGTDILETDPSVAGRVYLAGTSGLLVSDNAGEDWRAIPTLNNPQTFPIKALAINPKNPKEIICGATQATYKSVDGGESWLTSQFDNKMLLRVLKYNQANPSEIYVGFTN